MPWSIPATPLQPESHHKFYFLSFFAPTYLLQFTEFAESCCFSGHHPISFVPFTTTRHLTEV